MEIGGWSFVFGAIAAVISFFLLRKKGGIGRNILVFIIAFIMTGVMFLGVAQVLLPNASSAVQLSYSLVVFPSIAVGTIVGMVAAKRRKPKALAPQQ